jgi:hypothetical protein
LWGYVIFHNRGPLSSPDLAQKIDLGKNGSSKNSGQVDKFLNEMEDGTK